MKNYKIIFLIFILIFFPKVFALKFCHEDQDSFPWVLKSKKGLNILLLNQVATNLNIKFEYEPVPWKRCLNDLKKNLYDGAFASSYKKDRLEFGYYPTQDNTLEGPVDESKRIHTSQYSLYVRIQDKDNISWDGTTLLFKGKKTILAASLPGFSINDELIKKGLKLSEGTSQPDLLFKKLLGNRVDVVAMQSYRGDYLVKKFFLNKVLKLEPNLESKNYYIMFSKEFYEKQNDLAQKIWEEIKNTRESKIYIKQFNLFFSR